MTKSRNRQFAELARSTKLSELSEADIPAALTISAYGATLIDDAHATAARTTLGSVIGTDVQAHSSVLDNTTASFTTALNTKLSGIEANATADQTAAEVRALVESATDSNVFTDADHTKLNGIEASATADQTAAEIRTLVESATDSNVFTDADHTKLNGIEASATADQTDAEIKTAYENNSDTNAFTDALQTKLNGIATSANNYVHPNHSGEVTSTADGATVIADDVVDEANLKVSNSPTNGYFLSAQSGNTGGLTWAAVPAGYSDSDVDTHLNQSGASSGHFLQWNGSDYAWAAAGANQSLDTTSSPTFAALSVTGTVTANTFNATSDATLKTNIVPIQNPLDILEKITGVSFDWRDNEGSAEGVLAQDVEQVLPNAVSTDEKGKKSVSYNNLVGVLIEAVKGQQEQINKLKDKLNGLSG